MANPRVLTDEQKQKQKERRKRLSKTPEFKEKKSEWYQKNKDKVRQQTRDYRAARPGLNAFYVRRYEAKRRGNGIYVVTHKEIERLRKGSCFYCGSNEEKITLDHVIPIKLGGRHSIGNLVSACQSCNSSKQDKLVMEWKIQKGRKRATN
jgi:5-methylcytosine-specific restriction endonuclease McrA